MKRQAEGVSCELNEVEQTEANGNKRIKLLKNEANKGNIQPDVHGEKSVMDISLNEGSYEEDHHPSTKNGSSVVNGNAALEKDVSENNLIQNNTENESTENGNLDFMEKNCNGSHNEVATKDSASNSGIVSELFYSNSPENSVIHSEENKLSDDTDLEPPVLNHCNHDLQNNESTDSFQSEGFEANSCTVKSNIEVSEKHASQEQIDDDDKEIPFESDVKETCINAENFPLSHLKVTELQGHTDVVFSVAADEDFILSASADTTVKVWNMERQNNISTFSGHSDTITSLLLLNPNQSKALKKKMSLTKVSRIAITGSLDCHIKLWSVLEGKELSSVYTFNGITCLGYLESECLVVVGTEGGKLELWNLSSAKAIISVRGHEDAVTDIKVKDNFIYSASIDGTVKVWSYEDDDIYPVYTRKRKEISSDKTGFKPTQWKTVDVLDNVMYLGDVTNVIKVLDWKAGCLSLFKNQNESNSVCDCIVAENNMLFSTCYDSSADTSAINVWKLPEMTYVCSLTGPIPYISSLAVVQKDNKLMIISGGHKLSIYEFDFSRPPSAEGEFCVHELETLGHKINEKSVEIKNAENKSTTSNPNESSNRWCSIM